MGIIKKLPTERIGGGGGNVSGPFLMQYVTPAMGGTSLSLGVVVNQPGHIASEGMKHYLLVGNPISAAGDAS